MILYHYSVDSYKDGGELLNDFNKLRRFAEPFVFALEKARTAFGVRFSRQCTTPVSCAPSDYANARTT